MSSRKQRRVGQRDRQIWQLSATNYKQQVSWLLRSLVVSDSKRPVQAGFVLPATALVLLVMGLTVAALLFRTFNRTTQVIGDREQKIIYNTATPAIDRAKSKLEYLFKKDNRLPGGIPPTAVLASMILNDGKNGVPQALDDNGKSEDKYTLPGETRLDLNQDGTPDNAWAFKIDEDRNPRTEETTVAYSILLETQNGTVNIQQSTDADKAKSLVVRNGPITSSGAGSNNCPQESRTPEKGWYPVDNARLRKSFQINAFVVNNNPANRAVTTLELQQDRQVERGNKWGVWFRNDLEIFPGPKFNINGAMHTEGSLIVGGSNTLNSYMVSSHNSCIYTQDSSEITVAKTDNYEGQIISGTIKDNTFSSESNFHLFDGLGNEPIQSGDNTKLKPETDSVTVGSGTTVLPITLDPIALFTKNISQYRNQTGWSRDPAWEDRDFVKKGRIYNSTSPQPYIDDTYRADDRYGSKPSYSQAIGIPIGQKTGDQITSTDRNLAALTNNTITTANPEFGLDGYWERRATAQGLRLIVGQRLELGNTFGWGGVNDPLNPPSKTISHEQRQRRSLRDNLAAVQSTAIYHHNSPSGGTFPVACLATTVHPGTATTLAQSTDFRNRDFFTGRGTNGWEYAPPAIDEATFASAIASNQPLGKALRNLAYFAGDPDGAFPAKQETTDAIVHPYPYLTMWGDYSNLRRVFSRLDAASNATTYAQLSIADKTYLQTASCTLGMLANNINDARNTSNSLFSSPGDAVSLGEKIWQGFTGRGSDTTDLAPTYCKNGVCTIPPIEILLAGLKEDEIKQVLALNTTQQLKRDRNYGFASSAAGGAEFNFKDGSNSYRFTFSPECDPSPNNEKFIFKDAFKGGGGGLDPKKVGLAMICEVQTKYPALYYVFPVVNHDHDGNDDSRTPNGVNHTQPTTEPYVADPYIYNRGTGVNGSYTYQALSDANIASIAIAPKTTWTLPTTTIAPTAPTTRNTITDPNGNRLYVPFLDTALSNGREMMSVRVLNIDLDLLRNNQVVNDTWLPANGGTVYAFREDAIREDGIARPASTDWDTYIANPNNSTYRMNANTPSDPPVNKDNNISPKPVDYYADPDRRPYGFRLKNGATLKRNTTIIRDADNIYGLSLVTDNPVYIQGNFNLHSTDGTTSRLIEEFTEKLQDDWNAAPKFYSDRKTINKDFADPVRDYWRPTEILADAITILSSNFNDGSVEDITKTLASDRSTSNTSYQNQNRPKTQINANGAIKYWIRENPYQKTDSPLKIDRNGYPLYCRVDTVLCPSDQQRSYGDEPSSETKLEYRNFSEINSIRNDLIQPAPTRVNAIFVSGLVPSRANQSYGGLHNFPRFLEHWRDTKLYIAGAFLQLNFSTSATGPFDQDAWERSDEPKTGGEYIGYYDAPDRLWGYDVGLQYAPAGPVARRFVTSSNTRSEFYRELPVGDPYINNLRCAIFENQQIDVSATCSSP